MRRLVMILLLSVLVVAPGIPAAVAQPAGNAYLDLPAVNGLGERGGGLHPALPESEPRLRVALDAARASGVAPHRYATLLHQYWLVVATDRAGIDLADWDPQRGVAANAATFNQVYVNYFRLARAHPRFHWAGMAGIAGGSFASGFFDLDIGAAVLSVPGIHALGSGVADLMAALPAELTEVLPPDQDTFARLGPRLSADDLAWYQTRLMIMQRHIFLDLVPVHEAYLDHGFAGVTEMHAAGIIDDGLYRAWAGVDSGTAAGAAEGLVLMTDREQNRVVADQWDATAAGRDGMGRVLTYATTIGGKAAVPGSRAPGVFAPTSIAAEVGPQRWTLQAPLPAFNWADRADRWHYITSDLIPRHLDLVTDRARANSVYAEPFGTKLQRGRVFSRWPDLLADLTAHWQLVPS